jgi:hypothetical protein
MVPKELLSRSTRKEIKALLRGGYSHARFEKVMQEFPIDLRGVVVEGLPYSAWQVLEHMRIAQRSMLDYALQHLWIHQKDLRDNCDGLGTIGLSNKLLPATRAGSIPYEAFWKIGLILKP